MSLNLSAKFLGAHISETEDFEPQRSSHGLIYINISGNQNLVDIVKETTGLDASVANMVVAMSLDGFNLPNHGVDGFTLGWFGENIKFPGKASTEELTWTLRDFVDTKTADIFDAWYNLIYNVRTGALGKVSRYKTDCLVVLFNTEGGIPNFGISNVYRLEGCYPNRIERGDVDHAGGDYMKITVSLLIDRVIPVFLDKAKAGEFAGDKAEIPLLENLPSDQGSEVIVEDF